jgi:hypothetical protein
MGHSMETDSRPQSGSPDYSGLAQSVLALTAVAITLLPIPVMYFKVLPAYQQHAWFLLVYTPFMCVLTLCYLFYVRDSLARASFADVLNPPPPPDPYYVEQPSERLGRLYRRVKRILLGVTPALLVIASMYCAAGYLTTLEKSLDRSAAIYRQNVTASQEVAARTDRRRDSGRARLPGARQRGETTSVQGARVDSLPRPSDSTAVRAYLLRTARVDAIPDVVELTLFYLGAFLALLTAVTLMALKEYAKEALGLSEHELMFGRSRPAESEE